ncbi:hypothetical protein EDM68_01895 [Candidatus Uhrbacteria bacterium]|nr:MAG: hypothetical protein EDM68_01895 [Candidatus Uhrbacteria bacterium]
MEFQQERVASHEAFWLKGYPKNGARIVEILRPFQGRALALKPLIEDFEPRAKDAIFWWYFAGIHTVEEPPMGRGSLARDVRPLWDIDRTCRERFLGTLGETMFDAHHQRTNAEWTTLQRRMVRALDLRFLREPGRGLGRRLKNSLRLTLGIAAAYTFSEDRSLADRFKPYHDLWLTGNIPLGIDDKKRLVVLVGRTP